MMNSIELDEDMHDLSEARCVLFYLAVLHCSKAEVVMVLFVVVRAKSKAHRLGGGAEAPKAAASDMVTVCLRDRTPSIVLHNQYNIICMCAVILMLENCLHIIPGAQNCTRPTSSNFNSPDRTHQRHEIKHQDPVVNSSV